MTTINLTLSLALSLPMAYAAEMSEEPPVLEQIASPNMASGLAIILGVICWGLLLRKKTH